MWLQILANIGGALIGAIIVMVATRWFLMREINSSHFDWCRDLNCKGSKDHIKRNKRYRDGPY